ncbi:hypothetical protein RA267_29780, partial [Pseudomonas syringae pv. tagetis]|uniref:hypothetical protein n=1 Tax=Pseudomonas syringae group genomosp. 7 TaxID=251699 RepID=UPI00376FE1EF
WNCAPKSNAAAVDLPPRPVHDTTSVSSNGTVTTQSTSSGEQVAGTQLVTEAKGKFLRSRSDAYRHHDSVPREKLTAAQ